MLSAARRLAARRGGRGLLQPSLLRQFQSSVGKAQEPATNTEPVPLSKMKDSFMSGTSSTYLEELEERDRSNPKSVDKSWASFFHSMGKALSPPAARRLVACATICLLLACPMV